ncbi:hypothetical protein [Streptomyces sp. NPDC094032]|uniref:esterase/lipase family protein n=1 Tax=Streptomyces sp. NPDC094032 TaxID=3155308 RepID=UPI003316B591
MSTSVVDIWGSVAPKDRVAPNAEAPDPGDIWPLSGGTAWVYHSPLNRRQLVRPVILSDGFSAGASNLDQLWAGLEENGKYRFITELHATGRDVIILGYDNRTASITENAETVIDCIQRAKAERIGQAPLVVGGFSMGGIVTRYALAKMEQNPSLGDHETRLYLSFDSPHTGGWFPVALQAFTHYAAEHWGDDEANGSFIQLLAHLLNSPAAKQMARWHLSSADATAEPAQERVEFLQELEALGGWPQRPRKIGVANGVDTGVGNGIAPGAVAVRGDGENFSDTWLKIQEQGDQLVARLQKKGEPVTEVRTSGLPDIDGAPGGIFTFKTPLGDTGSFGLAALLMSLLGDTVDPDIITTSCFIPTRSAVAVGDIDDPKALYAPIDREASELDDFLCASANEGHTTMTEELGSWLVNEIAAG